MVGASSTVRATPSRLCRATRASRAPRKRSTPWTRLAGRTLRRARTCATRPSAASGGRAGRPRARRQAARPPSTAVTTARARFYSRPRTAEAKAKAKAKTMGIRTSPLLSRRRATMTIWRRWTGSRSAMTYAPPTSAASRPTRPRTAMTRTTRATCTRSARERTSRILRRKTTPRNSSNGPVPTQRSGPRRVWPSAVRYAVPSCAASCPSRCSPTASIRTGRRSAPCSLRAPS
mmetsp:Transcript_25690/g.47894  ORF Transcript_25690/g.47894 Transcript_25690/m.47894 type:complete len:233 (+) Transcript_25690:1266-1964(+)